MADQVHQAPPVGSGVMPCCGRTPFGVPITDRITSRAGSVTCGADARFQEAIDIVARHVIASGADERSGWWDMYPEIGEDDWATVGKRAEDLAPFPDKDQYAAAYDFLAGRAERVEP